MQYQVYAFGSNNFGKLGLGHEEDVSTATPCLWADGVGPSARPKSIASGGNHTIILCEDGTAWAAGYGHDGRLGFVTDEDQSSRFSRIKFMDEDGNLVEHFGFVSATWEASTFTSVSCDTVWSVGTGSRGELGQSQDKTNERAPARLPSFPLSKTRIIDLASCMSHTIVVLSNGEVYGWGAGRKGQLGMPATNVWLPRKVESVPFPAVKAVCGKDFTFVASTADSRSCTTLGNSGKYNINEKLTSNIAGWEHIVASWGNLYVLKNDGILHSWGRNDHGQLKPQDLPLVKSIVAGSEHVLAQDAAKNKIFAWGWGEHGNCGLPVCTSSDVKNGWNEVLSPMKAEILGAGCATSFLVSAISP